MKKFKKLLIIATGSLLLITIIAIVAIQLFGGSAVKLGVETAGTKALSVPVGLDGASLKLFAGSVRLKGLDVGNPEGYTNPSLLTLDKAFVDAGLGSLMNDTVEIEKIELDGIELVLEQKSLTNNLQQILEGMEKGTDEDTKEKEDDESQKELLIHELSITNTNVKVKLLPIPGRSSDVNIKLSPIVMKNLGTEDKLTLPTLVSKVLLVIAGGIAEQGKDILPTEIIGPMGETLTKAQEVIIDSGKAILGEGTKVGGDVIDKGKDIGKDVGKTLEGLLKKDK